MSSVQFNHTWHTAQGAVALVPSNGKYQLLLRSDNRDIHIPIAEQEQALLAGRVEEFVQNYFPFITNKDAEWKVDFQLSCTPDKLEPTKKSTSFGFEANSLEKVRSVNFSKDAPFFRRVTSGLNVRGECANEKCSSKSGTYNGIVYVPQGMGSFNFGQLKCNTNCPACSEKLPFKSITNLGFWNCEYEIEGQRQDEADPTKKTKVASKEAFTTFEEGDNVSWVYLNIKTKPIQSSDESSSSLCLLL